jgi:thymidylate synthase
LKVIEGDNPHCILPVALRHIINAGVRRDSRNGPVLQAPTEVATVYSSPRERVIFWPERDANPFFHIYEALWMLAGRNDVAGPTKYVKSFAQFSDDGETFHGAYGYRWRHWHTAGPDRDQLTQIADELRRDPKSRRCVLQMWNPNWDLGHDGKDLPCNLTVTFQTDPISRALNMVVFNRSNDILWGCYGANAVHFSYLHEYMSVLTGIPMGRYTQVSVNWHAYDNELLQRVSPIQLNYNVRNPYWDVHPMVMPSDPNQLDDTIQVLLEAADTDDWGRPILEPWSQMIASVLHAHSWYRRGDIQTALSVLPERSTVDWVVAARQWLERRRK